MAVCQSLPGSIVTIVDLTATEQSSLTQIQGVLSDLTSEQIVAAMGAGLRSFGISKAAAIVTFTSSPAPSAQTSTTSWGIFIGIAIGGLALIVLVAFLVYWKFIRSKRASILRGSSYHQNPTYGDNDSHILELSDQASTPISSPHPASASPPSPPQQRLPQSLSPPPPTVKYKDMFICSITQDVMEDPVFAADGYTYERVAIETWLKNHNTSPNTNQPLAHKNLVPNHNLRSMILEWKQKNDSRMAKLEQFRKKAKREAAERESAKATAAAAALSRPPDAVAAAGTVNEDSR